MSNSNYSARFLACVGLIIERIEGGFNVTPGDAGGATKFGISQAAFPSLDISNLTESQAIDLYLQNYWVPGGCSLLRPSLDLWLFDGAINHGVGEAVKLLQGACGTAPDGVMGPQTAAAANAMPEPELYLLARLKHYQSLPGWAQFGDGWSKRLFIIARGC